MGETLTVYGWFLNGVPVAVEADGAGLLAVLADDGFLVRRLTMTRAEYEALPEWGLPERPGGVLLDCQLAAAGEGG